MAPHLAAAAQYRVLHSLRRHVHSVKGDRSTELCFGRFTRGAREGRTAGDPSSGCRTHPHLYRNHKRTTATFKCCWHRAQDSEHLGPAQPKGVQGSPRRAGPRCGRSRRPARGGADSHQETLKYIMHVNRSIKVYSYLRERYKIDDRRKCRAWQDCRKRRIRRVQGHVWL